MFGKLKEALKKSFSIFSKKVEEKADEIPTKKVDTPSEPIEIKKKLQAEQSGRDKTERKEYDEKRETHQQNKQPQEKVNKEEIKEEHTNKEKELSPQDSTKSPIHPQVLSSPPTEEDTSPEKKSIFKRIFKKEDKEEKEQAISNKIVKENQTQESAAETEKKQNMFAKAKELLTTRRLSPEKFEELFWDIELALLENNVAVEVVQLMKSELKAKLVNKQLPRDLDSVVKESMREALGTILASSSEDIVAQSKKKKPFIIAFFGINGSGKTTTIAKVAHLLKENKCSCVIAAADTFRAAAIHQIEEHGTRLGIKVIKHDYGSDAAAVAFDAISYAKKSNIDVVLIDTAGRLHSDTNLMDELKKIVRIAKPDLKIFVGESIIGNDCIEQTTQFDGSIGIDAIILTKADIDEKGGTALSISYVTKKPILYLGMGQSYADLQLFNKEKVMQNLGLD